MTMPRRFSPPPGPSHPVDLGTIRRDPLSFLTGMLARHGDIARHQVDGWDVTIVNRPDLLHRVLRENRQNYVKSGTPDDLMLKPVLGTGLLTSHGDTWRRQRRLAQPAFERPRIEAVAPIMTEAAVQLLERWMAAADDRQPVRVDHDLSALTLTVVAQALLGSAISIANGNFGEAVDAVNRFMAHYDPRRGGTDQAAQEREVFAAALALLDRFVHGMIVTRRFSGPPGTGDLLSLLLEARDDTGRPMTDRELRDQMVTMVMAGHETTAKALSWTFHLLAHHPEVATTLRDELRRVLGGRRPTVEDLPFLPYARGVLEEAMRLYPPVWSICRRAVGDDVLGGYDVGAGSLVCMSPYALHRHPDLWDRPTAFLPQRFIPRLADGHQGCSYLPFGAGPRRCIGQVFAMIEAQLVVATLCQHVALRILPGQVVEPEALVTLRPRHGLLMLPERLHA
jgi:enediyne biosynthesis protein E7